jgi:hypothetical protein
VEIESDLPITIIVIIKRAIVIIFLAVKIRFSHHLTHSCEIVTWFKAVTESERVMLEVSHVYGDA